jgi:hypothetical protein
MMNMEMWWIQCEKRKDDHPSTKDDKRANADHEVATRVLVSSVAKGAGNGKKIVQHIIYRT